MNIHQQSIRPGLTEPVPPVEQTTWYSNPPARKWRCDPAAQDAYKFHVGLPDYAPTPLIEVPGLADALGIGRLFVKSESSRFGLPAFKSLGAFWAVARVVASAATGADVDSENDVKRDVASVSTSFDELRAKARTVSTIELVSATAGTHGRAVARIARLLGLRAHIYVPEFVPQTAVAAIAGEGAKVTSIHGCYDEAVLVAARYSEDDEYRRLIQDTAWPGYETIPSWIVDGYDTLFYEIDSQLNDAGAPPASLIAIPVGVGSLAQAAVTHYRSRATSDPGPSLLSVEPQAAACVLACLRLQRRTSITTRHTIMTGLNSGTTSSLSWPILQNGLDAAIAIRDEDTATAVSDLHESGIPSGPNGAASLAGSRRALATQSRRFELSITKTTCAVLLSTDSSE